MSLWKISKHSYCWHMQDWLFQKVCIFAQSAHSKRIYSLFPSMHPLLLAGANWSAFSKSHLTVQSLSCTVLVIWSLDNSSWLSFKKFGFKEGNTARPVSARPKCWGTARLLGNCPIRKLQKTESTEEQVRTDVPLCTPWTLRPTEWGLTQKAASPW